MDALQCVLYIIFISFMLTWYIKCHMRCPSMRTAGPAFIGFPGRPQDILTRSDACMMHLHASLILDVSSSTFIRVSVIHY